MTSLDIGGAPLAFPVIINNILIISGKAGGAPPTSREVIMGIMIPFILGVSFTCPFLVFIIIHVEIQTLLRV